MPGAKPKKSEPVRRRRELELERKVAALETRLQEAEARLERIERDASASPPTFQPVPAPPAPAFIPVPPPASVQRDDFERRLGASWLPKAGMVVLTLGVVFFLRYAFDQGWIGRPGRIALGVVGGLVLAGVGEFLLRRDRARFDVYAQILAGGGFIITYFSLFAAHAFPDYRAETGWSLELASSLMWAAGLVLAAYAVYRNTPVLAMEAVLLGCLAAFYARPWEPVAIAYLAVLSVAVAAASDRRHWTHVLAATVGASYLTLLFLATANDATAWTGLAAGGALAAVHTWAAGRARHEPFPTPFAPVAAAFALLGAWAVAISAFATLRFEGPVASGPATLAVGAAGILLAVAWRSTSLVRQSWGLTGALLVLTWPPMQFDDVPTAMAWSGLAAAAAAVHVLRRHGFVSAFTAAAGALLLLHFLFVQSPGLGSDIDLAQAAIPIVLGSAALLFVWWRDDSTENDRRLPMALAPLIVGLALPVFYLEGALEGFQVSIAWAGLATAALVTGLATKRARLRFAALGLYAFTLARVFLVDLIVLDVAVRIITFLAVGALLLAAGYLYARRQRTPPAAPPRLGAP